MAKLIPAVLAAAVAVACGGVQAQTGSGASYVTDGRSGEVRNAFAECWRSMGGTPALEACEPVSNTASMSADSRLRSPCLSRCRYRAP